MTRYRRKHNPVTIIGLGFVVLLALDIAWHLLPWLVAAAVVVVACRRWQLHRRALAWLRAQLRPGRPPRAARSSATEYAAVQRRVRPGLE